MTQRGLPYVEPLNHMNHIIVVVILEYLHNGEAGVDRDQDH